MAILVIDPLAGLFAFLIFQPAIGIGDFNAMKCFLDDFDPSGWRLGQIAGRSGQEVRTSSREKVESGGTDISRKPRFGRWMVMESLLMGGGRAKE